MNENLKIKISRDFTDTPGGRYKKDGEYSGEEFREDILIKRYQMAVESEKKLIIDFDGGYGYPPSFLEETFGGMVRKGFNKENLLKTFEFISDEEPKLIETIKKYIKDAR